MMRKYVHEVIILTIALCGLIGILFTETEEVTGYTPHAPISINGNADFASQASFEGWPGEGTEGNPYIIEGYKINVSLEIGITIEHTTVFFKIKNVIVRNMEEDKYYMNSGIYLFNTSNGIIKNCTIEGQWFGIKLDNSWGNGIFENMINNNREGIYLESSHMNNITDNTLRNNTWDAISLSNSDNNNIIENKLFNNSWQAISLSYSNGNNITSNYITGLFSSGISIYNSYGNNITFNFLDGYYEGISISNSKGNFIIDNNVRNYIWGGIIFDSSTEHHLFNNTLYETEILIKGELPQYWDSHFIDSSNTVNGKSVIYIRNQTNISLSIQGGQVILVSCMNVTIQNQELENCLIGLHFGFSSHNNITDNFFTNNRYGIYLYYSDWNVIKNNNFFMNQWGIHLSYSNNNSICKNQFTNNDKGVYIETSEANMVTENDIIGDIDGINLYDSNNNIIKNNSIKSINGSSIYVSFSGWNYLSHNTISSESGCGISISNSKLNDIVNNSISKSKIGLFITSSNLQSVSYNDIEENEVGVHIQYSHESQISNNTIKKNELFGIKLEGSYKNSVTHNTVDNSIYGIYSTSYFSIIQNNKIINIQHGIYLFNSYNIDIDENEMAGGGILILGSYIDLWERNIIGPSNKVNGKPVLFLRNQTKTPIPSNAGQVILVNCTDITVENQNLTHCSVGVQLASCLNIKVHNNNLSNNYFGLHLFQSKGIDISENIIWECEYAIKLEEESKTNTISNNWILYNGNGIYIVNSNNNNILKNNISFNNKTGIYIFSNNNYIIDNKVHNNDEGIFLSGAFYNTLELNYLSCNDRGICLIFSSGNKVNRNCIIENFQGFLIENSNNNRIHQNNIIDNTLQVNYSKSSNVWNDDYGRGNFWSDYNGIDDDEDGIGDTNIPHNGVDYYPYMELIDIYAEQDNSSEWKLNPSDSIFIIGLILLFSFLIRTLALPGRRKRRGISKQEPVKQIIQKTTSEVQRAQIPSQPSQENDIQK